MKPFIMPGLCDIGVELTYSLVLVILCLLVYFKTKEIYELTSHKGIKYFRDAFMFFAIAYLFRFLAHTSMFYEINFGIHPRIMPLICLLPFAFASSMAILSLAYSTLWKRLNFKEYNEIHILYLLAFLITITVLITSSLLIFLATQALLFIIAIVMSYKNFKEKKKKSHFASLYTTYGLLFLFWIFNLAIFARIRYLHDTKPIFYFISALIFGFIAYKVIKTTKTKYT
jgi:hypothetical protein